MFFLDHFINLNKYKFIYITIQIIIFFINNVYSELNTKYVVAREGAFKDAYDMLELLTTEQSIKIKKTTTTPKPIADDFWMKKMGDIKDDLLHIQAILVKDEDVEGACNQGHQKSHRRVIMCAASILNRNRILTTATCLHEAIYVRHNIRAPLAVVIAPLKPTVQVIRVAEYRIHPKHNFDPYSHEFLKYNLAILSLACRISSINYHKINLPTLPMTHICTEENCIIAVYRKSGFLNVIYQILAPQIPLYDRRRRSITDESREKMDEFNKKMRTDVFYDDSDLNLFENYTHHKIFKRTTTGVKACPQAGSAVMVNSTQTAAIAVSCDDRQGNTPFLYTDLYYNRDWIHGILDDWNRVEYPGNESTRSDQNKTHSPKNCGNCIFNFYISVGCKGGKGNCIKNHGMLYPQQKPKIIHNTRQVSNQEFMKAWSQAEKPINSWDTSRRFINNNNNNDNNHYQEFQSKLVNKCPSNSPECLQSLRQINGIRQRITTNQMKDEVNIVDEKPTRFVVNNPIMMRGRNHSRVNDLNRIFNYNGLKNIGNHSWIPRNPNKSIQNSHNIYEVKDLNDKKLIGEEKNNWLQRRHANNYNNPLIDRENSTINDSDIYY